MSWDLLPLITLFVAFLIFWSLRRFLAGARKLVYAIIGVVLLHVFGRAVMHHIYFMAHEAFMNTKPATFIRTVLTVGAGVWLFHRAFQTLVKPVSELVNILGVDIPPAPELCLAGIRSDAASLVWTRPQSHRLALKYLIQVNGIQVGEATGNDGGITITGLKPNHFYNIRVVAVGHNNFRSGSPVIRLRTFGKDGRPQLGNSRLPSNFVDADQSQTYTTDNSDDSDDLNISSLPAVEATPVVDGLGNSSRETFSVTSGQRRNTLNRRFSPSAASMDQTQARSLNSNEPEMSLLELTRKFEDIRREIETTLQLFAKEQAEAGQQEEELKRERDRKRVALKEKEEYTAQLRTTIRYTMEQMRMAEKERLKMEQSLKEKVSKKAKIQNNIAELEKEVERMKKERESFETQREALVKKRNHEVKELGDSNAELQKRCAELEAELKEKGKQLQDLKATRESLPGANDEQWKEEDERLKRAWESTRKGLHSRLVAESKQGVLLDQQIRALTQQLVIQQQQQQQQQQGGLNFYTQPPAGMMDYDSSIAAHDTKHPIFPGSGVGLGGTSMSSPPPMIHAEPNFHAQTGFTQMSFGSGLFMNMPSNAGGAAHPEAEFKAAVGPLSPTAQTLLPSNIFDDIEESSDVKKSDSPRLADPIAADDEGHRSPVSPAHSYHAFSSPHGSNPNLPFTHYGDTNERMSLNLNSSPIPPPPTDTHRLSNILSTLHISSRVPKESNEINEVGPPIGSLKPGQSRSFPRGNDDGEESRRRYWPWNTKSSTSQDASRGSSHALSSRRVNSMRGPRLSAIFDRDRGHSRPSSTTSMEHSSTDGGAIWGLPGEASGMVNHVWPPNENLWPSRSGSRRPSLHGSATALTTTLASAEDEILDDEDLRDPQTLARYVGVIGSRPPVTGPPNSKSLSQRLDPTARPFKNLFTRGQEKDKDRAKDNGKGKDIATPSTELLHGHDDFYLDSRVSKDTYSVRTGTSVSESHESLQLDLTRSKTPSDMNSVSTSNAKESDNVVKKLFRKGSSSKFSLSSRRGKESGLFKKGPGSSTNSDRNVSSEQRSSIGDADDFGDDGIQFGRSYDSMASSPSLGPSKSKEGRESRMSSWRFSMRMKSKDTISKERESVELERAHNEE